jgi:hypothetical protein
MPIAQYNLIKLHKGARKGAVACCTCFQVCKSSITHFLVRRFETISGRWPGHGLVKLSAASLAQARGRLQAGSCVLCWWCAAVLYVTSKYPISCTRARHLRLADSWRQHIAADAVVASSMRTRAQRASAATNSKTPVTCKPSLPDTPKVC